MAIQILPPQLANQIAAGEVVERPASVVKELVENCLDAGATRIEIDIDRGGSKMIRIRDNGCGIAKEELALALARHATSKIASLEDLEAILSLGFRGEALASISSVARLTLSSRTADQLEAWQAYAEGREMAVKIQPTAHPVGTTVEVLDLFYNTPARRRFLRTEKTEFSHIDEVVRRIALVRNDVAFNLSHNNKLVKQYRAGQGENSQERRLGTIFGPTFLDNALAVFWEHGELKICGWVVTPSYAKNFPEVQYCYVNGRMMRDRLLSHAIRQAYHERLAADLQPAYVLYLEVDPHQVDVNVHPAKHEVRFHQSRMVHDFVYQAITTVLRQAEQPLLINEGEVQTENIALTNRVSAGENMFSASAESTIKARPEASTLSDTKTSKESRQYRPVTLTTKQYAQESPLYQQLLDTSAPTDNSTLSAAKRELFPARPVGIPASSTSLTSAKVTIGRVLTIWQGSYAVVEHSLGLALIALKSAERYLRQVQLQPQGQPLRTQPLLIPLKIKIGEQERQAYSRYHELFDQLGLQLARQKESIEISGVPLPLRQQNLQKLIPALFDYLMSGDSVEIADVSFWLAGQLQGEHETWTVAKAVQVLAEVERLRPDLMQSFPQDLFQFIELSSVIAKFEHE